MVCVIQSTVVALGTRNNDGRQPVATGLSGTPPIETGNNHVLDVYAAAIPGRQLPQRQGRLPVQQRPCGLGEARHDERRAVPRQFTLHWEQRIR